MRVASYVFFCRLRCSPTDLQSQIFKLLTGVDLFSSINDADDAVRISRLQWFYAHMVPYCRLRDVETEEEMDAYFRAGKHAKHIFFPGKPFYARLISISATWF